MQLQGDVGYRQTEQLRAINKDTVPVKDLPIAKYVSSGHPLALQCEEHMHKSCCRQGTLQCHQDHEPDWSALSGSWSGQALQAGPGGLHSGLCCGATGVWAGQALSTQPSTFSPLEAVPRHWCCPQTMPCTCRCSLHCRGVWTGWCQWELACASQVRCLMIQILPKQFEYIPHLDRKLGKHLPSFTLCIRRHQMSAIWAFVFIWLL